MAKKYALNPTLVWVAPIGHSCIRRVSCTLALVFTVLAAIHAVSSAASENSSMRVSSASHQTLFETLAHSPNGTVAVILQPTLSVSEFSRHHTDESVANDNDNDKGRHEKAVQNRPSNALMRRLERSDQRAKWHPNSGLMSTRVTQQELVELLADSNINVFQDTLKRPALQQSVGRVYPTQNSSEFHGNNQWVVAVLDTGVDDTHPMLSGKVVSQACYSNGGGLATTASLCPAGVSASTAVGSGAACGLTGCGHGTQVAGVAVGNGASIDGVARDARLVSIQVYSQVNDESFCFPQRSCLGAFTSDIIAALERVYELRSGLDIAAVNLSLGSDELFSGSCDDQPERPIIDLLTASGIAVIAATGNAGDTSKMQSPACITRAVAVAATADNSDVPWVSNNTSNQVDLFAPGVNITTSDVGGGFATSSGTSLAAPHVAGAWAVIKHAAPRLNVAEIEGLLKSSGVRVTQNSVTRRRLSVSSVLSRVLNTGVTPDESDLLCFPLIAKNGNTATICL